MTATYCNQGQGCVDSIEKFHGSGLVFYWGFTRHLALEAEC